MTSIARALLLLSAIAFAPSALACDAEYRQRTPIIFLSDVSSTVQGANDEAIEKSLRDSLNSSGLYQAQSSEQFRAAEQNGTLDACTPAFGVIVTMRQENSDPGASMGLGGLVTRSMFIADIIVRQEPQGIIIDRFSLQEKMDGLLAGSSNSKAFKRLIDKVGGGIATRREAMLAAWKHVPPESSIQAIPHTSSTNGAQPGSYVPSIRNFRTLEEALEVSTYASYAADVGPGIAANIITSMRPDLRGISNCMQQRLNDNEEIEVIRAMRMTTAVNEAKLAGQRLDTEAAALAIYGSRQASEIAPEVQRGGILYTATIEYCTEQVRIRKALGY